MNMGARTMSLGTQEIDFLRETLHAQQELLQKLYTELDVERESSSTAADEALSMILRLQGERSALEMEASQYKRIAEEKMYHAQETLEIFQELIYQKEMQIASLEFQVQAYRFKLVSMGCEDMASCDMQYPENMLSRRNGMSGESSRSSLRRGCSLPPPIPDASSRRGSTEGAKSVQSSPKVTQEAKDGESSLRRESTAATDANLYLDEIKKLDERVKELAVINGVNDIPTSENPKGTTGPCSSDTEESVARVCNPSPESTPIKSEFLEYSEKEVSDPASGDSQSVVSVQDIFEVPQITEHHQGGMPHKREKRKLRLEVDNQDRKLDSVWDEIWKSDVKEKIDWEKKPLLSPGSKSDSPKHKDIKEKIEWEKKPLLYPGSNSNSPHQIDANEKIDWEKRPLLSPSNNNENPKSKEGKHADRQLLLKHPTYGVSDFELQQFNRRLRQLEDERFLTKGHERSADSGDDKLVLLREIREKIDSLQEDITMWAIQRPPRREERSLGCFKEVMLCFLP